MNTALAQSTSPASPSVSPSAPADKGVGYGQITKDGRKYENLTKKEVYELERAEKEAYYAWKNAQLDAEIIAIREETRNLQATVITKYNEYIDLFARLHSLRGQA